MTSARLIASRKPEVEALAGDRMQPLRRVADDGEPRRDVALGARQGKRIRGALADPQEAAEPEAERALELGEELGVGQREHALRPPRDVPRPDDAAATVGQWQDRDRTRPR